MSLDTFFKKTGLEINNKHLFRRAFTHRSYVNEHKDKDICHNERLEFLGDAVLELVVTQYLYKNYPKKPEGVFTSWRAALVKGKNLAKTADDLNINKYLRLSKGEEESGGRKKEMILADTMEAVIGALYLDQGYKKTQEFIKKWIIKYLPEIIKNKRHIDAKTYLQEKAQDEKDITPTYEVLEESGPDHNKKFKVGVYLENKKLAEGEGASKQKAQQKAANHAIKKYFPKKE